MKLSCATHSLRVMNQQYFIHGRTSDAAIAQEALHG
jgi:hypothetical protein